MLDRFRSLPAALAAFLFRRLPNSRFRSLNGAELARVVLAALGFSSVHAAVLAVLAAVQRDPRIFADPGDQLAASALLSAAIFALQRFYSGDGKSVADGPAKLHAAMFDAGTIAPGRVATLEGGVTHARAEAGPTPTAKPAGPYAGWLKEDGSIDVPPDASAEDLTTFLTFKSVGGPLTCTAEADPCTECPYRDRITRAEVDARGDTLPRLTVDQVLAIKQAGIIQPETARILIGFAPSKPAASVGYDSIRDELHLYRSLPASSDVFEDRLAACLAGINDDRKACGLPPLAVDPRVKPLTAGSTLEDRYYAVRALRDARWDGVIRPRPDATPAAPAPAPEQGPAEVPTP